MGSSQSSGNPEECNPKRILIVEVLDGRFSNAEARWGDWWTVGVIGFAQPYVVVKFGNETEVTETTQTQFGAHHGSTVTFGQRIIFGMSDDVDEDGLGSVDVSVFDRRVVQAAVRGDPLIGGATFCIKHSHPTTNQLELTRSGSDQPCGHLNVQYRVVERSKMGEIMSKSENYNLAAVVCAITATLQSPDGLDRLSSTKPDVAQSSSNVCLPAMPSDAEERRKLKELVSSFLTTQVTLHLDGSHLDKDDAQILLHFMEFSRTFLAFIADYAGTDHEPVDVAVQWIRAFFQESAHKDLRDRDNQPVIPVINEKRLRRALISAVIQKEDLVPASADGREFPLHVGLFSQGWRPGTLFPREQPSMIPDAVALGKGAHGSVWRAKDRCTGRLYAVKDMDVRGSVSKREAEMAILLRDELAHPCVVSLFGVFEYEEFHSRSVVMELCPCGDLSALIKERRDREGLYEAHSNSMLWVGQMFLALEHLHLTPPCMLVRDVKPANVVLTNGNMIAKLTDFGMSRQGATSNGHFSFHPKLPPGTPDYVAPEVVVGSQYNYSADLYSLGVLTWVLLTGGLLIHKGTKAPPRPPCGKFAGGNIKGLLDNWRLLKQCVETPERCEAVPLPCKTAVDFVLSLTDRGHGHTKVDHMHIRQHVLMQHLSLPENLATTQEWLERNKEQPPLLPWLSKDSGL